MPRTRLDATRERSLLATLNDDALRLFAVDDLPAQLLWSCVCHRFGALWQEELVKAKRGSSGLLRTTTFVYPPDDAGRLDLCGQRAVDVLVLPVVGVKLFCMSFELRIVLRRATRVLRVHDGSTSFVVSGCPVVFVPRHGPHRARTLHLAGELTLVHRADPHQPRTQCRVRVRLPLPAAAAMLQEVRFYLPAAFYAAFVETAIEKAVPPFVLVDPLHPQGAVHEQCLQQTANWPWNSVHRVSKERLVAATTTA